MLSYNIDELVFALLQYVRALLQYVRYYSYGMLETVSYQFYTFLTLWTF